MKRILITLAALAAAFEGRLLLVPGVDRSLWHRLTEAAGSSGQNAQVSVVALGLTPAISAFLIVELAAALVPRWRHLRRGGPFERHSLRIAALVLTVVVATTQAYFLANWMSQSFASIGGLLSPDLGSRLLAVVSLVGGTCFLLALVWLIDRFGVGGGFSVMLAASALPMLWSFGQSALFALDRDALDMPRLLPSLAGLVVLVIAAAWLLRRRDQPPALPAPASSVAPLLIAVGLMTLPVSLRNFGLEVPSPEPGSAAYYALVALLVALLTLALARAFIRPARLGEVWSRVRPLPDGAIDQARQRATRDSLLFNGGLLGALLLVDRLSLRADLDVLALAVLLAVTLDLVEEWRARAKQPTLVDVWPLHDVTLVAPALAALSRAGIFAHARAAHHRSLLQFFGPHVPIDLMVSKERAEQAQEILEAALIGPDQPM